MKRRVTRLQPRNIFLNHKGWRKTILKADSGEKSDFEAAITLPRSYNKKAYSGIGGGLVSRTFVRRHVL
jgi:hypothetical protein